MLRLNRASQRYAGQEASHGTAQDRLALNLDRDRDRDPDRKINDLEKELTTEDAESTEGGKRAKARELGMGGDGMMEWRIGGFKL